MEISIEQGWFSDLAGNESSSTLDDYDITITNDQLGDVETTVESITSDTHDGVYTTGDVITIQVEFSQKTVVDISGGTPTLTLSNGKPRRWLNRMTPKLKSLISVTPFRTR